MTRTETRRRALRAALAVSLTMGIMGCAAGVVVDNDTDETAPEDQPNPPGTPEQPSAVADAGPAVDSGPALDSGPTETDAGPTETDGGAVEMDASIADATDASSPDGGPLCNPNDDWEAYVACCEAVNWDYDAGCMAWGPPVPPAMSERRVA